MLFVKLVSDEEISFQLGSEISNVQREIKRTIPKITKKRLNKSKVRVLVALLSEKAGLKIFENRFDLFLVNFFKQNTIISSLLS